MCARAVVSTLPWAPSDPKVSTVLSRSIAASSPWASLVKGALGLSSLWIIVIYAQLLAAAAAKSLWEAALLGAVTAIPIFQLSFSLALYALHRRTARPIAGQKHTVDVLVTCNDEEPTLIEASARAARDMRGEHETWLLDDAANPNTERIAKELGVGYLTRDGHADAKAGNLNAALQRTSGEVVAVFDIDHQPEPDFLEATTPYFDDEKIGFVQAAVSFRNKSASWTARASAEFAYEYYNLVNVGKGTLGMATMMGSNSLIRRSALESISGYRPGLAEDLETSIAIHAAGWRSAYVDEPLAPGLAPEDFVSWHRQQSKWTQGVLEAATRSFKGSFWRLNLKGQLCYLLRFSYYFTGPLTVFGLFSLVWMAVLGTPGAEALLLSLIPMLAIGAVGRAVAMRCFARDPEASKASIWSAASLAISSWPNYCRGWLAFLRRESRPFVATPKARMNGGFAKLVRLQALTAVAIACLLLFDVTFRWEAVTHTPVVHLALLVLLASNIAVPLSIPSEVMGRLRATPFWRYLLIRGSRGSVATADDSR